MNNIYMGIRVDRCIANINQDARPVSIEVEAEDGTKLSIPYLMYLCVRSNKSLRYFVVIYYYLQNGGREIPVMKMSESILERIEWEMPYDDVYRPVKKEILEDSNKIHRRIMNTFNSDIIFTNVFGIMESKYSVSFRHHGKSKETRTIELRRIIANLLESNIEYVRNSVKR